MRVAGEKMIDITVVVMTYNQKDYIKQALDSILSQEVSADFDILIHDDCSDDGTYQILLDYQKKHPRKIRIIRQDSRKFLNEGFNMMIYNHVVPHISSRYVAYCDGDDYWCDNLKLQKQYNFMELHQEYSMCFHCSYQLRQNNDMSSKWFIKDEGDIGLIDLINEQPGIPIATSSLFVRTTTFINFSDWRKLYSVEDLPLYLTAAIKGKIHRLSDIMCVYRQFSNGSWSSQNKDNLKRLISHQENLVKGITLFDKATNYQYHEFVVNHIEGCEFRIARLKGDLETVFLKKNRRFLKQLSKKDKFSLKLQYKLPFLYNLLHKNRRINHL